MNGYWVNGVLRGFGLQPNPIEVMGSGSYPNPSLSSSSSSSSLLLHPIASRPAQLAGGERCPPAAIQAERASEESEREGEGGRERARAQEQQVS